MAGPLTVDVVAPDRVLWSGTAQSLVAPSVEGEMGLLTGHEPVLSVLRAGSVRLRAGADGDAEFRISGGFLSFDHDVVTVVIELASEAEPATEEPAGS